MKTMNTHRTQSTQNSEVNSDKQRQTRYRRESPMQAESNYTATADTFTRNTQYSRNHEDSYIDERIPMYDRW